MRYIYTCIEQLDLAASQLADANTASYGRFALILTDNIIELLLHRFCADAVSWDQRSYNRTPKFTAKERAELVGRHFDPKAKFCAREGAISQAELDFIRIAHSFRNEAYHVGLVHDEIIWDVAWAYHELACLLFGRWPINSWTTGGEKVSDAVVRHIGDEGAVSPYLRDATRRAKPAASLAAMKPRATRTLAAALHRDSSHASIPQWTRCSSLLRKIATSATRQRSFSLFSSTGTFIPMSRQLPRS